MKLLKWIVVIVVVVVIISMLGSDEETKTIKNQKKDIITKIEKPEVVVSAFLSNFVLETDRSLEETHGIVDRTQLFDINILSPVATTVYVVVYAKNDRHIPPRKKVWPPMAFSCSGSSRGLLSPSDITSNWGSNGKKRGYNFNIAWPCKLSPNQTLIVEGALHMDDVSQHKAWNPQKISYNARFEKYSLWIFNSSGKLIFEKKHNVQ